MTALLIIVLAWAWLNHRIAKAQRRLPDFRVGPENNPYLLRWWIIPRNRWFNIYLHKILRDDDDRALHDHPWWSISFPLAGSMSEWRHGANWQLMPRMLPRYLPVIRSPRTAHRLCVMQGPVWTPFVTGPVVREWGFWCVSKTQGVATARFVRWQDFVASDDAGAVGRGCGEG